MRDGGQEASLGHRQRCLLRDAQLSSLLQSSSPWAGAPSAGLATEETHCRFTGCGDMARHMAPSSCRTPSSEHKHLWWVKGMLHWRQSSQTTLLPLHSPPETSLAGPPKSYPPGKNHLLLVTVAARPCITSLLSHTNAPHLHQ